MQFKCNHCQVLISRQYFGEPVIKCTCGAVYKKTVTVVVTDETPSRTTH